VEHIKQPQRTNTVSHSEFLDSAYYTSKIDLFILFTTIKCPVTSWLCADYYVSN
jgi:hypothetical protein